mmetsp:Transcript_48138/g.92010  ORF Transcript_48138/g.92010 Transcript_48138/m.92010 type:complete len:173 (+) Transcript_48138:227-745(+)|eukprot:CAMPEP_0114261980 /NCGR_PEP_ID=MMETSP0058-20121206/21486_1 /TAXON_ID=36894 /ORGANISM="Pyramimonas parkeae, CCMP726" /LENGTH=172 /DNA_ID=CAMNT_0001377671 /DNA_START=221 /DNA_END=739 /DNA_ORIENTATION=-
MNASCQKHFTNVMCVTKTPVHMGKTIAVMHGFSQNRARVCVHRVQRSRTHKVWKCRASKKDLANQLESLDGDLGALLGEDSPPTPVSRERQVDSRLADLDANLGFLASDEQAVNPTGPKNMSEGLNEKQQLMPQLDPDQQLPDFDQGFLLNTAILLFVLTIASNTLYYIFLD